MNAVERRGLRKPEFFEAVAVHGVVALFGVELPIIDLCDVGQDLRLELVFAIEEFFQLIQ